MKEKQVIMSMQEFDEMNQELDALRETVKSKTITSIFRHNFGVSGFAIGTTNIRHVGTNIDFVIGGDENKIIEELSKDNETQNKAVIDYASRVFHLEQECSILKKSCNSWKNLPWYKRLFTNL